jgi:hypothetical protein
VVLSNRVRAEIDARAMMPRLLHRSAMGGLFRMSAYRCCSRKSTKRPEFEPHRILDDGLLPLVSMPRA